MLKKSYRLKNNSAFIATYKQRKSAADRLFIMYAGREKSDLNIPARLGFVVSKKIHKRAVKRNRIKRLMREACRLSLKNAELAHLSRFVSVIFVAKSEALDKDLCTVKSSILDLTRKIASKY